MGGPIAAAARTILNDPDTVAFIAIEAVRHQREHQKGLGPAIKAVLHHLADIPPPIETQEQGQ